MQPNLGNTKKEVYWSKCFQGISVYSESLTERFNDKNSSLKELIKAKKELETSMGTKPLRDLGSLSLRKRKKECYQRQLQ